MSRKRLPLFLFLLVGPAVAANDGAAPNIRSGKIKYAQSKLRFDYPCSLAYSGGAPYENRVMDYECDYMHATIKIAAAAFNNLPTIEAQETFLATAIADANKAHADYIIKIADLLKQTDPVNVPKNLAPVERDKKIRAMRDDLWKKVVDIAKPFLWPPRETESYIDPAARAWPKSWEPYHRPVWDRDGELFRLMQSAQTSIIDKAGSNLRKKMRHLEARADAGQFGNIYDGGGGRSTVSGAETAGAGRRPPAREVAQAAPVVSDIRMAAPPIPETTEGRKQRNYFARGTAAGLERLKDDAMLAAWHASGQAQTIGDPHGKAPLIIHQVGGSCAIGAQYLALRARGEKVKVSALAKEGFEKGYYVDYVLNSGQRVDGTPLDRTNALLKDHGVNSTYIKSEATLQQLDQALRASGDAIIIVRSRLFYQNPSIPDSAAHAIYVTGEEVDKNGKILGIYVNDTGTGEAARFVPMSIFKKAWDNKLVILHEK